jgi:hypothetical protein
MEDILVLIMDNNISLSSEKIIKELKQKYNCLINDYNNYNLPVKKFENIKKAIIIYDLGSTTLDILDKLINNYQDNTIELCTNNKLNLITILVNYLFNRDFKNVLPIICVFDYKIYENFLKGHKNTFTNKLDLILFALENNIKITYNEYNNYKDKNNLFKNISVLFPYILKKFIPYLVCLILFICIFYIKNDINDLKGIIFSNICAGVGEILIDIIMNYKILYKSNELKKNLLSILKKLIKIVLGSFIIYILYNLIGCSLIISKILGDLLLGILIYIIFKKVGL